jgi:hypothetical protein
MVDLITGQCTVTRHPHFEGVLALVSAKMVRMIDHSQMAVTSARTNEECRVTVQCNQVNLLLLLAFPALCGVAAAISFSRSPMRDYFFLNRLFISEQIFTRDARLAATSLTGTYFINSEW